MTKNQFRKIKSFTIIEALIAIFILEVGLLGLAGFYSSSFKTIRVARNETIAANLASGLLDEELSNSYNNLAVVDGSRTQYTGDSNSPFHNIEKEIDVTYIDENLNNSITETNMKKIIVTVYWQENGTEKNVQFASIKARR